MDVIYTDLVLLRRAHTVCNVASPPICLTSVHSPWIFPISLRPDLRHFWFPPSICSKTIELQWLSLKNFPSISCNALCLFFHHHLTCPEFYNFMTFFSELLASNSNYGCWIFGFPFFFFFLKIFFKFYKPLFSKFSKMYMQYFLNKMIFERFQ